MLCTNVHQVHFLYPSTDDSPPKKVPRVAKKSMIASHLLVNVSITHTVANHFQEQMYTLLSAVCFFCSKERKL